MRPDELLRQIKKNTIAPVCLLHGNNLRAVNQCVTALRTALFGDVEPDMDLQTFDAQVHQPQDIVQAARTVPLLFPRRMVLVRRAEAFREQQWKECERCFSAPSARCCLVITAQKLPPKRWADLLKKNGVTVECSNPRGERQVRALLREELRRRGLTATDAALDYMVETVAADGQSVAAEAAKIELYCRGRKQVDLRDAQSIITGSGSVTIFKATDEIFSGNRLQALVYLHDLLIDNYEPLVFLKMVARHLRLVSRAHEALRHGEGAAGAARRTGAKDWLAEKYAKQARGWSQTALSRAFEEIFQADVRIKTSRLDRRFVLEDLVGKLVQLRNQPAA